MQSATAEKIAHDIMYHPPTVHYWVPSPDSLTTIYTWAQLAIATRVNASWVNDPQVDLKTL